MKKIFHLATCKTCQRVLKELNPGDEIELREIKSEGIRPEELDAMKELAGSYEALFSRRAMKYRSMGLNEMELSESDYRKYILEEYTFLKRPVVVIDDQIFIGSAKKHVQGAKEAMG
jgi:arsenate reductase